MSVGWVEVRNEPQPNLRYRLFVSVDVTCRNRWEFIRKQRINLHLTALATFY
jgi:hypothetical protein